MSISMDFLKGGITGFSQWITVLRNALWVTGGMLAAFAALGVYLYSLEENTRFHVIIGVSALILVFVLGSIVGGVLLHRVGLEKCAPFAYRIIYQEHEYIFDKKDPRKHKQILTTKIKARTSGTMMIEYRYYWTGEGDSPRIIGVGNDFDVLQNRHWMQDEYKVFYVRLRHPLAKGELRTIKLRFEMYDRNGEFRPVCAKWIRENIRELKLIVQFPRRLCPKKGEIRGFRGRVGDERAKRVFPIMWDERSQTATLSVSSPRKNDTYGIVWEWEYPPVRATSLQ